MPHFLCWSADHTQDQGRVVLGYEAEDAAEDYVTALYNEEPSEYHQGAEVFTRLVLTQDPLTVSSLTQAWKVEVEDWTPHFVAEPA